MRLPGRVCPAGRGACRGPGSSRVRLRVGTCSGACRGASFLLCAPHVRCGHAPSLRHPLLALQRASGQPLQPPAEEGAPRLCSL